MVVKELPQSPVRDYKDADGSAVHLITLEEAMLEKKLLNIYLILVLVVVILLKLLIM